MRFDRRSSVESSAYAARESNRTTFVLLVERRQREEERGGGRGIRLSDQLRETGGSELLSQADDDLRVGLRGERAESAWRLRVVKKSTSFGSASLSTGLQVFGELELRGGHVSAARKRVGNASGNVSTAFARSAMSPDRRRVLISVWISGTGSSSFAASRGVRSTRRTGS
jgi:hypothetical protein